jgi:drug/metabolite transporter (DMT)-like permease
MGLLMIFISGAQNQHVYSNTSDRNKEQLANALCLLNAMFYGFYEAVYKRVTIVGNDLPSVWRPFLVIKHFLFSLKSAFVLLYYRIRGGAGIPSAERAQDQPEGLPANNVQISIVTSLKDGESIEIQKQREKVSDDQDSSDSVGNQHVGNLYLRYHETLRNDIKISLADTQTLTRMPSRTSSSFLGLQYFCWIGVFTFLTQWPLLPLLYFSGLEVPRIAPNVSPLALVMNLFLNATLSVIFNLCFLLTVTLTSPVFASLGTMVVIPLSAYIDYLFFDKHFDAFLILGTLFIFFSFSLMIYAEYSESQVECV